MNLLTALGSKDRLASTVRGLFPTPVTNGDLANPKLWARFRANSAHERLRPLSIGGDTFLTTTDQAVIQDLPSTSSSAFLSQPLSLPPLQAETLVR